MDSVKITPSLLFGTAEAPPSKSFAHRGLIGAFLSNSDCTIHNIKPSKDICATLECIKNLGGNFDFNQAEAAIKFKKSSADNLSDSIKLDCGESGSTLRFLIPIALCFCENIEFIGHGRLMERPLLPYFDIFDKKGISYLKDGNTLKVCGRLTSGEYVLDGTISSQFITGLLFALPLINGDSCIKISGDLSSKGYIDITLSVLKDFGIEIENENYASFYIKGNQKYKAKNYTVEGDFSQAAFFLVLGALGCKVSCTGLNPCSIQGDRRIIDILKLAGANVKQCSPAGFTASAGINMHGIDIDADEIPDLVPILSVLLCFCKGRSRIFNASRLRLKESDRLASVKDALTSLGANIIEGPDFLEIYGVDSLKGGKASSFNDHRIAMSLAVAACRAKGIVEIEGAFSSVQKSYPDFFEEYKKLGGKIL